MMMDKLRRILVRLLRHRYWSATEIPPTSPTYRKYKLERQKIELWLLAGARVSPFLFRSPNNIFSSLGYHAPRRGLPWSKLSYPLIWEWLQTRHLDKACSESIKMVHAFLHSNFISINSKVRIIGIQRC